MDDQKAFWYDMIVEEGFISDGKHAVEAIELAPEQEALCETPSGDILGLVGVINENELYVKGNLLDQNFTSLCEFGLVASGRIYALYTSADGKVLCYLGSGFKVSQAVVLTAGHVCAPITVKDGVTYTFQAAYMNFKPDTSGTIGEESPNYPYCYRLRLLQHPALHQLNCGYVLKDGTVQPWTPPNDFSFLTLDDDRGGNAERFRSISYVYPVITPHVLHGNCFVIGYPGVLSPSTLALNYPNLKYETVTRIFAGFQKKTVSFGVTTGLAFNSITGENLNLIHHNANAIPGDSGGLFLAYNESRDIQGFSGIHVGGVLAINQNCVLSTTNINLALSYFNAISIDTQDFMLMDRARLQPYYNHFVQQLPQTVRDTFVNFFFE